MKQGKWIVCLSTGAMAASLQPLFMTLLSLAERGGHPVLEALEGPIAVAWWLLSLPAIAVAGRGALTIAFLVVFWFVAGVLIARCIYDRYKRQHEGSRAP
jgi:hypothetical protein